MHLVFDIFQGIGIAAAVGIRPFLPALVAGALSAAGAELHFNHSHTYSFLQGVPMLFALAVVGAAFLAAERGLGDGSFNRRVVVVVLGAVTAVLAGLEFTGALAQGHYTSWPGYPAGVLCAGVALLAARPLFERVRSRLDESAAAAVPLYAEGAAILLAALSVLAPPVGPIGLLGLIWLLVAGRRRAGQKYAGLRILR